MGGGSVVRVDGVVVIIASRTQEGSPVDAGIGNGVIEDLQNGVGLVGVEGAATVQVARKLSPISTADGASDAAMVHIGGNAGKVEGVGALGREDRLARAAPRAVV